MDLSVHAPSTAPLQRVGTIQRSWAPDEPLFLDPARSGPEVPFATLDDAIAGAAYMARSGQITKSHRDESRGTFVIRRAGDAFEAVRLLQPAWKRVLPANERMDGVRGLRIYGAEQRPGGGVDVSFVTRRPGDYGSSKAATGRLRIDTSLDAVAVVGSDWALVDGKLRPAEARDPFAEPPAPPRPLGLVLEDAIGRIHESIKLIETVPATDTGDASTKQARIGAYELNMQAQKIIEDAFLRDDQPEATISALRTADAHLEDANWQLAKKPSPDGRFNGVDIPGALRDSHAAIDVLKGIKLQPKDEQLD